MKTELERQDIEAIAQRVSELIKSQYSCNCKSDEEKLFTPEELSNFLRVKKLRYTHG